MGNSFTIALSGGRFQFAYFFSVVDPLPVVCDRPWLAPEVRVSFEPFSCCA